MKKLLIVIFILLTLTSCMTKTVEKWSNIAVNYTGKLEDGTIFDSTEKHWGKALEFQAWAGQMIPGFDAWVIGMKLWEKKIIEIEAKDAYGEYDESKKQTIEKKDLESFIAAWFKLEKGEKLPTNAWTFEIIEENEKSVVIDVNNALAWKKLIFEVEIKEIK